MQKTEHSLASLCKALGPEGSHWFKDKFGHWVLALRKLAVSLEANSVVRSRVEVLIR